MKEKRHITNRTLSATHGTGCHGGLNCISTSSHRQAQGIAMHRTHPEQEGLRHLLTVFGVFCQIFEQKFL